MLKKIALIALSGIFALISFELFLTFSPFEYGLSPVKYDSDIGMWHKKNFSNYIIKDCYKTKYSFDDKGLPKSLFEYDNHKKDVIVLGDSFVEAIMVKNENVIHNSLSKVYNNKYNFLNYGLSGSSPIQQYVILKSKVNLSNTKYVIQFINLEGDLLDVDSKNLDSFARPKVFMDFKSFDDYTIIPPRKETLNDHIGDILGNYQIYQFIKKTIYYIKDDLLHHNKKIVLHQELNQSTGHTNLTKNWLYLEASIYQTKKLLKSVNKNIEYKIIIKSDNKEHKEIIKKFLLNEQIDSIVINDLAADMNLKLKSFECDEHWNDSAHQNVAKIIHTIGFIQ